MDCCSSKLKALQDLFPSNVLMHCVLYKRASTVFALLSLEFAVVDNSLCCSGEQGTQGHVWLDVVSSVGCRTLFFMLPSCEACPQTERAATLICSFTVTQQGSFRLVPHVQVVY
jgi:hypothetical protein